MEVWVPVHKDILQTKRSVLRESFTSHCTAAVAQGNVSTARATSSDSVQGQREKESASGGTEEEGPRQAGSEADLMTGARYLDGA